MSGEMVAAMGDLRRKFEEFSRHGGFIRLQDRAFFVLSGSDRSRYLNGQITQAVERLAADETRYACALDAKGGIVTELYFRLAEDGEAYLLDVPVDVKEHAAARLERYIIADDVTLEDMTGSLSLIHVMGVKQPVAGLPVGVRVLQANRFGLPGFDLLAPAGSEQAVLEALKEGGAVELPVELVESLRMERGVAAWGRELLASTLPHEAGITERAVSFTKGCYIGQEVVSRIQSVGSPSRKLCLLTPLRAGGDLLPGAELHPHGQPDSKPCGQVTSAGFSFTLDKPVALAYLKRGFHEPGGLVEAKIPGVQSPPCPATIISTVPT